MITVEMYTLGRVAHADDTATVTLYAYTYEDTLKREVASERVPMKWSETLNSYVVESDTAARLVHEHVGEHYSPVWQGRGWTVEVAVGYALWTTNG